MYIEKYKLIVYPPMALHTDSLKKELQRKKANSEGAGRKGEKHYILTDVNQTRIMGIRYAQ